VDQAHRHCSTAWRGNQLKPRQLLIEIKLRSMSDTFSIGVNRLIRIVPPTDEASLLHPESCPPAQRQGNAGML
jgi:hypothetical protein